MNLDKCQKDVILHSFGRVTVALQDVATAIAATLAPIADACGAMTRTMARLGEQVMITVNEGPRPCVLCGKPAIGEHNGQPYCGPTCERVLKARPKKRAAVKKREGERR